MHECMKWLRLAFALPMIALTAAACAADTDDGSGTPSDDIGQTSDAITVCADGPTVKGVDVSHYQGSINWTKVAGAGYTFVVMKASEGTSYTDPTFKTNWAAAKNAGLVRGAYHFFRANVDGKAQAKHFASVIGTLGKQDLPPVLDLETQDGVSDATVISRAKAFLTELESLTGKTPIIYSGYFFTSLGSPSGFAKYPLWVANWGVSCPNIPNGGWKKWTFWQFTDHQSVAGIGGSVDADRFNGTKADLLAFAKGPDQKVEGVFETATCNKLAGWAWDPDTPAKALDVQIWADGTPSTGTLIKTVKANQTRNDLCKPLGGNCDHAFSIALPAKLEDGALHKLRAYATGDAGGAVLLEGGALSVTCEAPATGTGGAGGAGGAGEAGAAGSAGEPSSSGGASGSSGSSGSSGAAGSSSETSHAEATDSGGCSTASGQSNGGSWIWLVGVGLVSLTTRRRRVR